VQIITAENGKPLADSRGEISYGGASSLPSLLRVERETDSIALGQQAATSRASTRSSASRRLDLG